MFELDILSIDLKVKRMFNFIKILSKEIMSELFR
jgi:hypothetical protein